MQRPVSLPFKSATISLHITSEAPNDDGSLEPDCFVELLCTSCLRLEIGDFYEGFAQSSIPLGADESPDVCLFRQIGFAVVPLMLSDRESQLLIDELRIDGFEMAVN